MDRNDQAAIEYLFNKLDDVERRSPPRDRGAEAFVREQIARQPNAPYYMAQTIVVQEQALNHAQERIEELEQQVRSAPARAGLFSEMFGGGRAAAPSGSVPRVGRGVGASQQPSARDYPQTGGGGFLAGAAQTAMGVAGGVLLGNAIGGLFGSHDAKAGETSKQDSDTDANDEGHDAADDPDDGGDFGGDDFGGGDFDA